MSGHPRELDISDIYNRAGLNEISYRIADHDLFYARMLSDVSTVIVRDPDAASDLMPLQNFTRRVPGDPAIGIMEAWAASLDVLTFYQERLANEGYIRTAQSRRSIVELSRMIGYELPRGVAASVFLAFTVEHADDPFRVVTVEKGVPVGSVPKTKDDKPQTFETAETLDLRAEWNAIPVRTEHRQTLCIYWNKDDTADSKNGQLYLVDIERNMAIADDAPAEDVYQISRATSSNFHSISGLIDFDEIFTDLEADALLNPDLDTEIAAILTDEIYLRGIGLGIKPGSRLASISVPNAEEKIETLALQVMTMEEVREYQLTRVSVAPIEKNENWRPATPRSFSFMTAFLRPAIFSALRVPLDRTNVNSRIRKSNWSGSYLTAFVKTQGWKRDEVMRLTKSLTVEDNVASEVQNSGLYLFRERMGFFGVNAPKFAALSKSEEQNVSQPHGAISWDDGTNTIWTDSQGVRFANGVSAYTERDTVSALPQGLLLAEASSGHTAILQIKSSGMESRADYAMSGKSTALTLQTPDGVEFSPFTSSTAASVKLAYQPFTFRKTSAYLGSQKLNIGGLPITEDLEEGASELMLDGLYLDLEEGRPISISGERADAPGIMASEAAVIDEVQHVGGYTRLFFKSGLEFSYVRTSISVNANVMLATHGETVEEILGNGDTSISNQAFALKKPPLTFVAGNSSSGADPELVIRVDGVAWFRVDDFFTSGPNDQVYILRIDDDGTVRVIFGDGLKGSRLPQGELNITAQYRSGIGLEGEVKEETLTQLKRPPIGIKRVINPSHASGAANPQSIETARIIAPQTTKTLGRIVSLQDYEDFARNYAGIGKAKASIISGAEFDFVHVTISPESDSTIEASAPILSQLHSAMDRLRDKVLPLKIEPYAQKFFQLKVQVFYNSRYLPDEL